VAGSLIGRRTTKVFDFPCRPNTIPRELPKLPWFLSSFCLFPLFFSFPFMKVQVSCFLPFGGRCSPFPVGFKVFLVFVFLPLPFRALLFGLFCIFQNIWGRQSGLSYGLLAVVFTLALVNTAVLLFYYSFSYYFFALNEVLG
jgi:hypothetical protein